ncbi:hypothetical protein SAM23877_1032 [Streptomyces ambofaciens ATCC 23877]|uniref:Uncharacterized protein n=1 Tax=Streptomyces ambofaciens (strain ATCC 23877 / 3486 / DSM 40053 / JCM 4204 / NBRC 12836 / NRRL B-2516) TaxID=278992 RepID=A0A0K2AMF1_STRA7|nr:hypothetical protein SAM23877_1032 [Streptomyces ambofaciens ATCC 23877]
MGQVFRAGRRVSGGRRTGYPDLCGHSHAWRDTETLEHRDAAARPSHGRPSGLPALRS